MTTTHTRRPRKNTNDRITIEALSYYAPIFKQGDDAEELLLNGGLSPAELNYYETQTQRKELALKKIAALSGPLITSEINKLISTSHLAYSEDLFDLLYYAGLAGLGKGLRHFDEEKMKKSATNYLFQWFVVYAKRELSILEAPFGIAPSRFQKYKKIAAVRKKLTAELERAVTNEEIYEYFQSGKADLKTMNGRVGSSDKPSQANLSITMELIGEQEEFEQHYMHMELLDPLADYSSEVKLSKTDAEPFSQTVFGVFADSYGVSMKARAVLLSELGSGQITPDESHVAATLTPEEYKLFANAWKDLIKDPRGPFYEFLKQVEGHSFEQFDIASTLETIEAGKRSTPRRRYQILFDAGGTDRK